MRIRLGRRAKGEVEAFLDEVHQASAEIDVEAHVRITGPVVGQYAAKTGLAIHTGAVSRKTPRGVTTVWLTAASTSSNPSSICRACSKYSAPVSVRLTRRLVRLKRRVGEALLEVGHMLAGHGRRQAQPVRRGGEAFQLRHRAKNAQAHQGVHRIVNSQEMLHQRNS